MSGRCSSDSHCHIQHFQFPFPYSWVLSGSLTVTETHFQGKAVKHWKHPYEIAKLTERGLVLSLKRESSETLFINNFLHFTGAVKASDCQTPQAHRTQHKHPTLQPSSTFLISHRKVLPVHKKLLVIQKSTRVCCAQERILGWFLPTCSVRKSEQVRALLAMERHSPQSNKT